MKLLGIYLFKYLSYTLLLCNIKISRAMLLKFTKLECLEFDSPFADFKECYLTALARDKIGLHLHVRLHQVPVNNVSVNAELFRKSYTQSYQPFMYNTTMDFCQFLKHQSRHLFWKIVYQVIRSQSNINHTCPFGHDIIVNNLVLDGGMLKLIPFPTGEYLVKIKVAAYNHYKAEVRAYMAIKE